MLARSKKVGNSNQQGCLLHGKEELVVFGLISQQQIP
jgi:hypothetical protein